MSWAYDSDSPRRDESVPVEEEASRAFQEEPLPWRNKLTRLWRALRSRRAR